MNPTRPGHRHRRGPRAAAPASPAIRLRHLAGPGLLLVMVVLAGCGAGGQDAAPAARPDPPVATAPAAAEQAGAPADDAGAAGRSAQGGSAATTQTTQEDPAVAGQAPRDDPAAAGQATQAAGTLRPIAPLTAGEAVAPVNPPQTTSDPRVTVKPKTTDKPKQGAGGGSPTPKSSKSPGAGGGQGPSGKSPAPQKSPTPRTSATPADKKTTPATVPPTTAVPVTHSGSSGGWLLGGLALVLVVGGVAAGAVFVARGRRAPQMEAWPPGVPTMQPSHPGGPAARIGGFPAAAPVGTATPPWTASGGGLGHLTAALREVAAGGVSDALAQQIDRLLASEPGRDALVDACIRFRDQLGERQPLLADRLLDALGSAGVREIGADGQSFDGRVHEAVDVVPTADPRLQDVVAATERPGYVDGDRVVRVPRVSVYRLER
ncbi:hypothetical protein GCM10023194_20480 [Planotetraspora phitsanulokensis]|uniref:GrpE protein n=1 Tax=Planotetraspora phitsanulokensis TaxID=575192 RepID=A0A8J3XGT0_9ACTN|nr:nucleotide exchange factor GrpE [Planotetraspora phitsanulokensis]GII39321.1 hypothetical protein Pph01_43240 [Planotetraspora phitsanulokensis]